KTEFKVTERSRDGASDVDVESDFGEQIHARERERDLDRERERERPWERIPHAS
ncbi:hypothetical protein IFR05_016754, partial [Cadophora sp. M221]